MAAPVYLYYVNAFAVNADAGGAANPVVIPNSNDPGGAVSYNQGYTDPYEYNLLSNPDALPVTRPVFNQLMYDITNNIQEYQNYGTPQWVSGAQIPGSSAGYPIGARVYYNNAVYESQVPTNTATPGVALSNWLQISGASDGIQPGFIIDYASPIAPAGYLLCDGSSYLRSGAGSYPNLFNAITFTQSVTTTISTTVTVANAYTTMYPGMYVESPNLAAPTTILTVNSNTSITLNAAFVTASASTITFFPWGAVDSTHFYVPDLTAQVTAGSGGTLEGNAGSNVDVPGQYTGATTYSLQANDLPPHNHPVGGSPTGASSSDAGYGQGTSATSFNTGNNTTSHNAISLVQMTTIVYKIIKT